MATKARIIVSGCSGGGKSSLISELGRRGYAVVPEPGRRIVRSGMADPISDPERFAALAIAMSLEDIKRVRGQPGPVFFDRGLIDAAAALSHAAGIPLSETVGDIGFFGKVFFAPPWSAIFENDDERRHDIASAREEAERLEAIYLALGYDLVRLPFTFVRERADFVLGELQPLRAR